MKRKNTLTKFMRLVAVCLAMVFVAATTGSADFIEQRRKFRDEIKNKIETELDEDGRYYSVTFKGEENKYDFKVTDEDRGRLKQEAASYFGTKDAGLQEKMVDELDRGRFVIQKVYQDDGVSLQVMFLSPKAKYWEWLTNGNEIEKMFHVYNFSVGLDEPTEHSHHILIQTEGSFLGITQAVTLPVYFEADKAGRTYSFNMPTQAEIIKAVEDMAPVKPGRTKPREKFLDACRTHPYFQQMEDGEYVIDDEEVLEYYEDIVLNMNEECPVKEMNGAWKIREDYPYLVVTYSLKTRVNIDAFIPSSLKFMGGALENVAQSISDEVSVKYLPLSMKNFRDHTQAWTKAGGPPE